MKGFLKLVLVMSMVGANVFAVTCNLMTTRIPCKGKSVQSFEKCQGNNPCITSEKSANAEICKNLAVAACYNSRTDITQKKTVIATFSDANGTTVTLKNTNGDEDFCTLDNQSFTDATGAKLKYSIGTSFPYYSNAAGICE